VRHVDFDFGDGNRAANVLPSATTGSTTTTTTNTGTTNGTTTGSTTGTTNSTTGNSTAAAGTTTVSTNHTYAQHGSYTVKATVHFTLTGANGTTTEHQETCTLQVTTQQPVVQGAATERPQAPAILPETGVGTFLAVFVAASLIGTAGYYLYTKRRLAQI
jgi:LPXTG-motif cell wall-anchored protein